MFPLIYLMIHTEFSVSSFDLALNDTSTMLSSSLNILMSLEKNLSNQNTFNPCLIYIYGLKRSTLNSYYIYIQLYSEYLQGTR